MNWRHNLLLAGLGLGIAVLVAFFQPKPGYMDADYYYAGSRQLATGQGFTEEYLWNYLDNPSGLPHPSNAYWMPLASLVASAGAVLFGSGSWSAARVGFLAMAAALPPLTYALAWSLTSRRDLALTSGLLAVFPAFYMPFLPVTDTFGLYMLLGGLFFLLIFRSSPRIATRLSYLVPSFFLGIISGLMHLSRTDGLLWLLMAMVAVLFVLPKPSLHTALFSIFALFLTVFGYLLIMVPWFARNISAFGTPMAPGGTKMLWLTSYDQLFSFPSSQLTFSSWWHSGISAILNSRLWALGLNFASALTVQGEIFLLPLIGLGFWVFRKDRRLQLAALAWLLTIVVMTVVFPFAGARGGFFHSGAALQTIWWVLAPLGLERLVEWGRRKRGWNAAQAGRIFRIALIGLSILLTAVVIWTRVIGGNGGQSWGQENAIYDQINKYLVSQGATDGEVVMVANPPGYYLSSSNPSIAIPDGDINTLLAVAQKYKAHYMILEAGSVPAGLLPVYDSPKGQKDLTYLSEIEHAQIFRIHYP
jgi:hypothetical protein